MAKDKNPSFPAHQESGR